MSATNSQQKQSRAPHSPPPDENHMSWSNTEAQQQLSPQSSNVNVLLLLKNKETFGKNFPETPGLCVLRVLKVKMWYKKHLTIASALTLKVPLL